MPRISRKCYEGNYFHLMVQGIKKEFIFESNKFKEKYIKYLIEEADKFSVKILAYCIMENHAHMLVYVKNIERISKMMHSLNTRYAIYYNKKLDRCGYVFRDRYRCENILTQGHLENCVRYIHKNPVEAGICQKESEYIFSTYNQYVTKTGIITDKVIKLTLGNLKDYMLKLNYNMISDKFLEVENEFGNNKTEDVDDVILEINAREKEEIKNLDNSQIVESVKEILTRCNTSKKEIAKKVNIERTKLLRILKNS